jgi:predicted N-acyltransferase
MLTVLLFNHQYAVCNGELGALLKVNELSFEEKIDKWEKRKYKQAIKVNLKFTSIPNKKLKEVYQFISNCRKERGHDLSMSFDELNLTVSKLKDSFFCFGAYLDGKMVAASISIRESKSTFYNFYSAHNKESDSLSPMVFLIGELYTYCKKNKIHFLDLGTSALGGTPNFSLIDFKLRLGAIPSMKLTFEKELT